MILLVTATVSYATLIEKYLRYSSDISVEGMERLVICQGNSFNEDNVRDLNYRYPLIKFVLDSSYVGLPMATVRSSIIDKYCQGYDYIFMTDDDFHFTDAGLQAVPLVAASMRKKGVGLVNFRWKGAGNDGDPEDLSNRTRNPFSISTCSGILFDLNDYRVGMVLLEVAIPKDLLLGVTFHEEAIIAMAIYLMGSDLAIFDSSIKHVRSKVEGIELKLKLENKIESSNHFKRLAEKYNLYKKSSDTYYPAKGRESKLVDSIHEENKKLCQSI